MFSSAHRSNMIVYFNMLFKQSSSYVESSSNINDFFMFFNSSISLVLQRFLAQLLQKKIFFINFGYDFVSRIFIKA